VRYCGAVRCVKVPIGGCIAMQYNAMQFNAVEWHRNRSSEVSACNQCSEASFWFHSFHPLSPSYFMSSHSHSSSPSPLSAFLYIYLALSTSVHRGISGGWKHRRDSREYPSASAAVAVKAAEEERRHEQEKDSTHNNTCEAMQVPWAVDEK